MSTRLKALLYPAPPAASLAGATTIPYFPSADDPDRQGFVRVVNHADSGGEVAIQAIDDAGNAHRIMLAIDADETVHFNSDDLEMGNAGKGPSGGVGVGEGDWRLEITSEPKVEALAYLRTPDDGFLTSMVDIVPGIGHRYRIATFNPASNVNQLSRLRLVNPGDQPVELEFVGIDGQASRPNCR